MGRSETRGKEEPVAIQFRWLSRRLKCQCQSLTNRSSGIQPGMQFPEEMSWRAAKDDL
jgi:hypothetical protein